MEYIIILIIWRYLICGQAIKYTASDCKAVIKMQRHLLFGLRANWKISEDKLGKLSEYGDALKLLS